MREYLTFYVDGRWVDPVELRVIDVENPATERVCGKIAFGRWSQSSREERQGIVGYGTSGTAD